MPEQPQVIAGPWAALRWFGDNETMIVRLNEDGEPTQLIAKVYGPPGSPDTELFQKAAIVRTQRDQLYELALLVLDDHDDHGQCQLVPALVTRLREVITAVEELDG